ncbi:MAG: FAD-dependent oxidoreductase, partial [Thermodesulfobacteriota bacterium]|nr:FAD-dependent oxidoreductase [Thermodesulfobacteriota bacterium]
MHYLIIGNGIAGVSAAESIRVLDPEGNITMIADETSGPYCRPMISLVLEGSVHHDELPIRSESFYDDLKIKSYLGQRVTDIDIDDKSVSTQDGRTFHFDKLLIATGADPKPIDGKGLDLKNIFFMRTQAHVQQMLEILPHSKRALVLGGGLVGFKASYGLLRRGLDVTMAISSGYPLSMQVDTEAGNMILDELVDHGLKVKVGVDAVSFEGQEKLVRAHLSDGTEVPCDMVVIGKGVTPSISFVPNNIIKVDVGILVNQFMETNVSGVFAAGDVAETFDVARQSRWINAIWPEAVFQGRIAGMNMAGRPVSYGGSVGRNIIRIFDVDVMAGGLINPPDASEYKTICFSNPSTKIYRKLVFHENLLVGVIVVNEIEQGGVLISLMQNQTPIRIPKEAMLEPSFNY